MRRIIRPRAFAVLKTLHRLHIEREIVMSIRDNYIRRIFKTALTVLLRNLLTLSMVAWLPSVALSQGKGGRDATPPKTPPKRVTAKGINRPAPRLRLATVTLNVSPADSTLLIDDQPSDKVDALGTAKLTELKPGQHSVTVRKAGYRERQQSLELKAGDNEPVSITLELLKGTLNVLPGVSEAEINLKSVDRNQGVGSYSGSITQVEFRLATMR